MVGREGAYNLLDEIGEKIFARLVLAEGKANDPHPVDALQLLLWVARAQLRAEEIEGDVTPGGGSGAQCAVTCACRLAHPDAPWVSATQLVWARRTSCQRRATRHRSPAVEFTICFFTLC